MKNNRPHDNNDDGESLKDKSDQCIYKNILSIYRILYLANDRVRYERVINIQCVPYNHLQGINRNIIIPTRYFHIPSNEDKEWRNFILIRC